MKMILERIYEIYENIYGKKEEIKLPTKEITQNINQKTNRGNIGVENASVKPEDPHKQRVSG